MVRALNDELYLLVFQHMSMLPFSHARSNEESFERQMDLLNCAKTCKLWNVLASPSLYRIPVVHSLPLFLATDFPPIAGLTPKTELLKRVERLFLDYKKFDVADESLSEEEVREYATSVTDEDLEKCRVELAKLKHAEEILANLRKLLDGSTRPQAIFPKLRTLSTNAFSGAHRIMAWPKADRSERWATVLDASKTALYDLLEHIPSIRHYCGTGGSGPLSLPRDIVFVSYYTPSRTMSNHSSILAPVLGPMSIGLRTRWYVHSYDEDTNFFPHDNAVALQEAASRMKRHFDHRRMLAQDPEYAPDVVDWNITGGLYAGVPEGPADSSLEENEAYCRQEAASYNRGLAKVMPGGASGLPNKIKVKDDFVIKSLLDAPECDACGWECINPGRPPGFYEAGVASMGPQD